MTFIVKYVNVFMSMKIYKKQEYVGCLPIKRPNDVEV